MKQQRQRAVDAPSLLRELTKRWGGSRTLEYRSRAVLHHAGELRVEAAVHVQLRRPHFARMLFDADRPDMTRLRVCDGVFLFDRTRTAPLRPARTTREPFADTVVANLPHPLDEVSYCVDQFFNPAPFVPGLRWGEANKPRVLTGETIPAPSGLQTAAHDVFRLVFERGQTRDTLLLEPVSLRPLQVVRVGEHAGQLQELLRETFGDFSLGAFLPPPLFVWSEADDRGETLRREARP